MASLTFLGVVSLADRFGMNTEMSMTPGAAVMDVHISEAWEGSMMMICRAFSFGMYKAQSGVVVRYVLLCYQGLSIYV